MRYIHDLWKFSLWLLTDNKLTGYRLPSTHSNNSISEYWIICMLNQILMDVQNISAFTDWSEPYVWKIFTIFWQVQLYQSTHADTCIYVCVKQLLYSVILTKMLLSPTLRKDLHVLLRKNMFRTLAYNSFWIWLAITSTDVPTIKNYIELRQRWGLWCCSSMSPLQNGHN